MSSLKLLDLFGPEAADRLAAAVTDVAERSFFSAAEPCDDERFGDLAAAEDRWLAACVRFEERDCTGAVSCRLPESLARGLFDAFSGRDPSEDPPATPALYDLVGEFSNMVCGTWLTRLASHQAFALSRPTVGAIEGTADEVLPFDARLRMAVNDLPLVVDVVVSAMKSAEAIAGV